MKYGRLLQVRKEARARLLLSTPLANITKLIELANLMPHCLGENSSCSRETFLDADGNENQDPHGTWTTC